MYLPKKFIAALLTLALLLTGCASIMDGEYSSSREHTRAGNPLPDTAERTAEVADITQLYDEVLSFVEDHIEYGKVKFTAYEGDVQADLASVCVQVSKDTAIGAYCVYYLGYNLNMIVSHYEADISVTYRRTAEEVSSILDLTGAAPEALSEALMEAIEAHSLGLTFLSEDGAVTPAAVHAAMEELYFGSPERVLYLPEADISVYPEAGVPSIVEVTLTYPYSAQATEARRDAAVSSIDGYLAALGELSGDDAIRALARAMASNVAIDTERENHDDYSKWYNVYTAYGALVLNRAAGEGFALAMKILCDRLGIECVVVRGRLNNVTHSWNIVRLEDGSTYHMDVSMLTEAEEEPAEPVPDTEAPPEPEAEPDIFYTDAEMGGSYWWEAELYPVCDGPSLQPEPPLEPEPEAPPADSTAPVTDPGEPVAPPDAPVTDPIGEEPTEPGDDPGEGDTPPAEGGEPEPGTADEPPAEGGAPEPSGEDGEGDTEPENPPETPPDEPPGEGSEPADGE